MNIEIWAVVGVLFLGAFIRSALGFGDALLAMPALALVIGLRISTPLVQMISTTIAVAILLSDWKRVEVATTWHLIVATMIGIPVGIMLLRFAPETYGQIILGVLLIAFAIYRLYTPALAQLRSRRWAYLFGFAAGILGGWFNTNGPPIVAYGTMRRWSAERFRATMQGYFLPTGMLILAGHAVSGLWTQQVFHLYALAAPFVLVGVFLGGKLNRYLAGRGFERVVYFALLLMGIFLIF